MARTQHLRQQMEETKRTTNSKPIPHIPLPFKEVMADVLKVKPPQKERALSKDKKRPKS